MTFCKVREKSESFVKSGIEMKDAYNLNSQGLKWRFTLTNIYHLNGARK